jgi:GH15 family glucan-1,4-alpha-glucosidase
MQMNYLAALAARRWGRDELAEAIGGMSRAAVEHSRFAEHWNPETGEGHGAIPLTWSGLVVTFTR